MNELALGIGIAWLGYTIYKTVKDRRAIKKSKEDYKLVCQLEERIELIYKRNGEMITHVMELRMVGDHSTAEMLQENIDRDLKEMREINEKINQIIFASK